MGDFIYTERFDPVLSPAILRAYICASSGSTLLASNCGGRVAGLTESARKGRGSRDMGETVDDGACGEWQRVPEEIVQRLGDVPGAAYEVPDEVTCALEAGHDGSHTAVLQGWGDDEVWLLWTMPKTIVSPSCREDGLTCLLAAGHTGRHHVLIADVVEDEGPYWVADRAELEARLAASQPGPSA